MVLVPRRERYGSRSTRRRRAILAGLLCRLGSRGLLVRSRLQAFMGEVRCGISAVRLSSIYGVLLPFAFPNIAVCGGGRASIHHACRLDDGGG